MKPEDGGLCHELEVLLFGGHLHGITVNRRGTVELVTNACVSRVRGNHDGTTVKGYWRCEGREDGTVQREFVAWPLNGQA